MKRSQIETVRQRGAVMDVIACGRWHTTREIAVALPWAVQNVWQRLRELAAMGVVDVRSFGGTPSRPTESQWRASRKPPQDAEPSEVGATIGEPTGHARDATESQGDTPTGVSDG
mgnify:CR=1 FL=1|jgi:hypothetical protein